MTLDTRSDFYIWSLKFYFYYLLLVTFLRVTIAIFKIYLCENLEVFSWKTTF